MNVFLLVEEFEQDTFSNKRGEPASPYSTIIGIYEDKDKAEHEKNCFEERNQNSDCSYFIEERPLL